MKPTNETDLATSRLLPLSASSVAMNCQSISNDYQIRSSEITPPPELVQEWVAEIWHEGTPVRVALSDTHIATRAAQWGADQELEACCVLMD